jgi:transcriptional regulator with PAS, ATPase and Fis domain
MTPSETSRRLAQWTARVGAGALLETLSTALPDVAVFVVDERRNVLFWSRGAERLLGFPADEVLGEHCLKSNRCAACMKGCGVAEHRRLSDVSLSLYTATSEVRDVLKSGQAFFDDDGRFLGAIEVLRESTSLEPKRPTHPHRDDATDFHGLLSRDPEMLAVFDTIRRVARTSASVLVRGESGSGKELVARAIHAESARHGHPFIAVNCASLAPNLVESELFGHVRGAFTGAISDRAGLFEQASTGTLFLDEIGELSLEAQAKLLRVLEDGTVVRVGDSRRIPVDVRVVAATHRSLRDDVRTGRFREDLMYRLRVVPVFIPPLRRRRRDIDLLFWHFVDRGGAVRRIESIAPDAMRALLDHAWPGNVRELRNVVEYALAVGRGAVIRRDDLPPELREEAVRAAAGPADADREEAARIRRVLVETQGHLGHAAERLGMSRTTLWRKRRALGL